MFIDKTKIFIQAGSGGNGCVSFRREKYVPFGGPDGGNGGKGGDVYIESEPHKKTLLDLTYKPHFVAENGSHGEGNNKYGKSGNDLIIKVPVGTVLYKDTRIIADLDKPDQRILVAKGGRGGRGNASFKTHSNTAPRISEKGEPGEKGEIELQLKLIADVGIIGLPNAGKSTLLSRISSARPKIANYPFTTLSPNLGVARHKTKNFVVADLPGLIEGAHKGKGLGIEFLRHIERTSILLHLIDVMNYEKKSPYKNFLIINKELQRYSPVLIKKPMVVVLNKIDITDSDRKIKEFRKKYKKKIFKISAVTGEGVTKLLDNIIELLSKKSSDSLKVEHIDISEEPKIYRVEPEFKVEKKRNIFVVSGKKIEKLFAMTNFEQQEALSRFLNILKKMGVEKALQKQGIKAGDTVKISNFEFTYV